MRKLGLLAAVAALAGFGFAGVANAGLLVTKTAACVDPSGPTAVDINAIPVGIVIDCTFMITVTAGIGQTVEDIVVKDTVSSDLEVDGFSFNESQGAATEGARRGNKNKGSTPIEWDVGTLTDSSATLTFVASTNLDPGGFQRYTTCEEPVLLNSGPTAKGLELNEAGKLKKVSADGIGIVGMTEACPE